MDTITELFIIPAETAPYRLAVKEGEQISSLINTVVGGWFDCVYKENIVGYVHDTGIIDGLPINTIASALFGRILAGTCVIVGTMSLEGEYDGYNHDILADDRTKLGHLSEVWKMWDEARMSKGTL
jgi:hypothetical protein